MGNLKSSFKGLYVLLRSVVFGKRGTGSRELGRDLIVQGSSFLYIIE